MRTMDENIEMLSRSVLSDANNAAEQVLAEAASRADAIRERAKQQAAAERERILDQAARDAQRIRGQALATAQLQVRTRTLEHREALLDKVFDAAIAQLPSLEQWSDYDKIALQLTREALIGLGVEEAVIHTDAYTGQMLTRDVLKQLTEDLKVEVKVGSSLEKGVGVIAESADGRVNFDNTLETRLERLRNTLRAPVYHLLMGESI